MTSRQRSSASLAAATLAIVLLGNACRDHPIPTAPTPSLDRSIVTGAAAAALDANGHFALPKAPDLGADGVSQQRAESFADAYIPEFLPKVHSVLERHRGAPIDLDALRRCGRTYFASTAFAPIPADAPPFVRHAFGPYWIVTYCEADGAAALSIAVSALASNLTLVKGNIISNGPSGEEFFPVPIPPGAELPLSPERAVALVAEATGRRVTNVPQLVIARKLDIPQVAVWRVDLESPAHAASSDERVSDEATLFVGPAPETTAAPTLFRAAADPTPEVIAYALDALHPTQGKKELALQRVANAPRSLEAVHIQH